MAKKKTKSLRDMVPRITHRKQNPPLPTMSGPLKNVESLGSAIRYVRQAFKGMDIGKDFDSALKKRGLLKNGKLQGRAAR